MVTVCLPSAMEELLIPWGPGQGKQLGMSVTVSPGSRCPVSVATDRGKPVRCGLSTRGRRGQWSTEYWTKGCLHFFLFRHEHGRATEEEDRRRHPACASGPWPVAARRRKEVRRSLEHAGQDRAR